MIRLNITVFCGANPGNKEIYRESARKLAEWIVKNGHQLIYGGRINGLMGDLSNEVLSLGGKAIGVIPEFLFDRETINRNLTEIKMVPDMPERKRVMMHLGDAFIALPGGPGTLEEISEAISWTRIGQNDNPCILFNTDGYYDRLKDMFDKMVEDEFLSKEDRSLILFSDDLSEIEEFIKNYRTIRRQ